VVTVISSTMLATALICSTRFFKTVQTHS
jgi:hypothetical protein